MSKIQISHWGHGCLSLVSIVCCQVEVCASGWSFIQRSPIDCGVSECDNEASIMKRTRSTRGRCAMKKYIYNCWAQKEIFHAEILFWCSLKQRFHCTSFLEALHLSLLHSLLTHPSILEHFNSHRILLLCFKGKCASFRDSAPSFGWMLTSC